MHVMRDAYSFWARVFTALGAVNTHHASLQLRHFMDSPFYLPPPPKIIACDPGTTISNIGPISKRCLGIYRFFCAIDIS